MQTILDLFAATFPELDLPPGDASDLATMPTDSECGDDCRKAIEAAKAYADLLRRAHADYSPPYVQPIARSAADLCLLYICG